MAVESSDFEPSPRASKANLATSSSKPETGLVPNPLIDDLVKEHAKRGVLIPLKTTQEVRQDHTVVRAYITRAPTKCANEVIS